MCAAHTVILVHGIGFHVVRSNFFFCVFSLFAFIWVWVVPGTNGRTLE